MSFFKHVTEFKSVVADVSTIVRAELGEVKTDLTGEFSEFRDELREEASAIRSKSGISTKTQ